MFDEKVAQALEQPLDKNLIAYREESWAGGRKIPYLKAHAVIDQANKIFGYDGWNYEIIELVKISAREIEKIDYKTKATKSGWEVGMQCKVRVTVGNVTREDVGYGSGIDYNSPATCYESAGKEAVSDALKRTFRTFGNQFGNCLYDADFRAELDGDPPAAKSAPAQTAGGKKPYGGKASGKPMTGEITENQKKFAVKLAKDKGKNLDDYLPSGKKLDELSKQEASEIIDRLNKE